MKPLLTILSITLLLIGCAGEPLARYYQPYNGQQQNWPVATGGFTTQYDGMTIYHSAPNVPYTVLGRLSRANLPLSQIVSCARFHSADAVLLMEQQINGLQTDPGMMFFGNNMAVQTPGNTKAVSRTLATAYFIKTKSSP